MSDEIKVEFDSPEKMQSFQKFVDKRDSSNQSYGSVSDYGGSRYWSNIGTLKRDEVKDFTRLGQDIDMHGGKILGD